MLTTFGSVKQYFDFNRLELELCNGCKRPGKIKRRKTDVDDEIAKRPTPVWCEVEQIGLSRRWKSIWLLGQQAEPLAKETLSRLGNGPVYIPHWHNET